MSLRIHLFLVFISFSIVASAQDYPYDIEYRDFIHYDKNQIKFYNDSSSYMALYDKFDDLIFRGDGQINIVHFGGSHIQAGALTGRFSQRLQTMHPGLVGSRGYVFPYNLTRTNTPRNYYVKHTGQWSTCRNVERRHSILGVAGLSASTDQPNSSLAFYLTPNAYEPYKFNRVKVLHDVSDSEFDIQITNVENEVIEVNKEQGYTLFRLAREVDSLEMKFVKTDTIQDYFTFYGVSLEIEGPGITYHGLGVNGSSIPSYLKCQLFEKQLKALKPDWIIMTLGTNDAYTRHFNPNYYNANYDSLITKIQRAVPGVPILLTVPNDSYLYRRYMNRNTAVCGKEIEKLARKYNLGTWDFYNVMGGLNSITLWCKAGLAARDKIHFSRHGYFLQADLLFNAFLKSYDHHLENKNKVVLSEVEHEINFPDLTLINEP